MVSTSTDNLNLDLLKSREFLRQMIIMHFNKICIIYVSDKFNSFIDPYVINQRINPGDGRMIIKLLIIPLHYSTFFNPFNGINEKFFFDKDKAGARDFDGDFIYIFAGDDNFN
jgi:hypothetical protein